MIPVKVITKEESMNLGENIIAVGVAASGKIGSDVPEKIHEKIIIRANGKKEIVFMSEERKKQLNKNNGLVKYLNQFEKVEGMEIKTYLNNNKLVN